MCSFVWSFDQNLIRPNLRCLLTWRVEGNIFWENRFWELLDYLGERYKGKLGNKCSSVQKPPFADVRQNRCSQKFRNIYRKTLVLESLFNKVAGHIKKGVVKYFTKFTGNTCSSVSFLIKLQVEVSAGCFCLS